MDNKELYDKMKPSAFIIAELSVLIARLESADNALSNFPIVTPHKYTRVIQDIRRMVQNVRNEMISEQSVHEKRIDELFGVIEDTLPF